MLGCKCCSSSSISDFSLELIDTCWDVNNSVKQVNDKTTVELIDTCWDVNLIETSSNALVTMN